MEIKLSLKAQQRAMRKIYNQHYIDYVNQEVFDKPITCEICDKETKEGYVLEFTMCCDYISFKICNDCCKKHVKGEIND